MYISCLVCGDLVCYNVLKFIDPAKECKLRCPPIKFHDGTPPKMLLEAGFPTRSHVSQVFPCDISQVQLVLIGSHMGSNMEPLSMVEACFGQAGVVLKTTVLGTTYPFPDTWRKVLMI